MMKLKICLDLDDCIFDWRNAHEQKFNCVVSKLSFEEVNNQVFSCKKDKNFWSNLNLLERPDFEPVCYCTKRINSKVYTKTCLNKHNLPIKPIYQVYNQHDNKARFIKGRCDVLIDDSYDNVIQCIKAGVPAFLIERPHNKHIKTPYKVKKLQYKLIEEKYNELFR